MQLCREERGTVVDPPIATILQSSRRFSELLLPRRYTFRLSIAPSTGSVQSRLRVIHYRSLRDENRSMSAMPRKPPLAVKASSVARDRPKAKWSGGRPRRERNYALVVYL